MLYGKKKIDFGYWRPPVAEFTKLRSKEQVKIEYFNIGSLQNAWTKKN